MKTIRQESKAATTALKIRGNKKRSITLQGSSVNWGGDRFCQSILEPSLDQAKVPSGRMLLMIAYTLALNS